MLRLEGKSRSREDSESSIAVGQVRDEGQIRRVTVEMVRKGSQGCVLGLGKVCFWIMSWGERSEVVEAE